MMCDKNVRKLVCANFSSISHNFFHQEYYFCYARQSLYCPPDLINCYCIIALAHFDSSGLSCITGMKHVQRANTTWWNLF